MTKHPLTQDFTQEKARFARRLRTARRHASLTIEALATHTGLGEAYISNVENRKSNPSLLICMRLARGIGVDLGDLLSSRAVPALDRPTDAE